MNQPTVSKGLVSVVSAVIQVQLRSGGEPNEKNPERTGSGAMDLGFHVWHRMDAVS